MLVLLVGTGVYISIRLGFMQFRKFGYAMKNTLGKIFTKQEAGEGEITPFQSVTTALAATVGTGNIAGVTGAIAIGGPGAVFWMWVSALFGMLTKYSEVVLAVHFRERNEKGEWAGGPMYYIKNGLGKKWNWLAIFFCIMAAIAALGVGNMTQINTITTSINTAIDAFGGNTAANAVMIFGNPVPVTSLVIGILTAIIVAVVLFGGTKRIGSVTEKLVPFMAVVYILAAIVVVLFNVDSVGRVFAMIFEGAFNPQAVTGGAVGVVLMTTIQKGIGRGVFSNEAGLGSAPMAHASTSEKNPVKQGLYGIFEVFISTMLICTLTALVVLCGVDKGVNVAWGKDAGTNLVIASFGLIFGQQVGALLIAVAIGLFSLSTILGWALYGCRCCEFMFGSKSIPVYQVIYVLMTVLGAMLELDVVWSISDTMNGFMAIPNLIAVLCLSGVVIKLTKEHFNEHKLQK
ncbi:MAG: sodium:alanine symporter family protein [Oscillospiraceae bacterium]|nr:sodium:alanine symporter family protein [Oscillospiraceae bacterium]